MRPTRGSAPGRAGIDVAVQDHGRRAVGTEGRLSHGEPNGQRKTRLSTVVETQLNTTPDSASDAWSDK
jgi:hypothetical protein